ncbi:siroheme synthase [Sphingomonas sp.]|uniref:precorrin-2 dehydrogenase/sirohydrochlorin ferrochelatase family protein n=1 Tax=Sphingomonas sp. TaxID=28214 RepID=UPI0035C87E71
MHSLPIFVRLQGRAVILVGEGETAEAKRRLLERAGAVVVGEEGKLLPFRGGVGGGAGVSPSPALAERPHPNPSPEGEGLIGPRLAIVVDDEAAVARLKARGVLVNAVDRPDLCDFTLPAIVDRSPVIVAVGTGGASAGLAAALRQRLEAILPAGLGALADALFAGRDAIRREFPASTERRRAIAAALAPGGDLDPLGPDPDVTFWLGAEELRTAPTRDLASITLTSPDPDDLTLRQARLLANADRVTHGADVPRAILDRARADAARIETAAPPVDAPAGLNVDVRMA